MLDSDDRATTVLRNVWNYLSIDTALNIGRQKAETLNPVVASPLT